MRFTFDSESVGDSKTVLVDWKIADGAETFYNLYELPEQLVFTNKGVINKKKLYFTNEPITFTDKVYDGTCDMATEFDIKPITTDGGV